MQQIANNEIQRAVNFFGRTIYDEKKGATFFNWSGSGFEIEFKGKRLDIEFAAVEKDFPPEGIQWPWVSVFLDDDVKPVKELCIDRHLDKVIVFNSETIQRHKLKVVKRSENDKGKVGVRLIELDGEIVQSEPYKYDCRIEYIGDSITCGFGNESTSRDDLFTAGCENGLAAYGAVAAGLLNAEYHSVCISGIPLSKPADPKFRFIIPDYPDLNDPIIAMEDYYEYTDRLYEEMLGKTENFKKWDFSAFKPDAIIINLGTNDSFRIKAVQDKKSEENHFETRYKDFLYKVRRLNGDWPVIGCTLGSMDYYLYDNILRAVEAYKTETMDKKVFCYKFSGIFPWEEGYGAGDHPSVATHRRMGIELSDVLKEWLPRCNEEIQAYSEAVQK